MQPPVQSKFLLWAFLFTIVCHGSAMLSMLLFLAPGLPGSVSLESQVQYIATHTIQWRLGWFPWQLTALSDLILAIALIRTSWIPRRAAFGALVFTLVAISVEQPWEYLWITRGVQLAVARDIAGYQEFSKQAFEWTSYWAASFYGFAAICWSLCLAKSGVWNRWLSLLSWTTWPLLLTLSITPIFVPHFPIMAVVIGDGIGFSLMMLWFLVATYLIYERQSRTGTF